MPRLIITAAARLNRPRVRWALTLGWTALVAVLMWWPSMKTPPTFLGELTDKVGHFILFGGLGALWLRALYLGQSTQGNMRLWRAMLVVLGGCMLFSLATEWGQRFVPGREVALGDLAANWSGVGLGIALAAYAILRRQRWVHGERPLP